MLWVRFPLEEINYLICSYLHSGVVESEALFSVTQHAISSEFDEKWRAECLNTRFLLITLIHEGCMSSNFI